MFEAVEGSHLVSNEPAIITHPPSPPVSEHILNMLVDGMTSIVLLRGWSKLTPMTPVRGNFTEITFMKRHRGAKAS